mgnify:CR=1 FL=1
MWDRLAEQLWYGCFFGGCALPTLFLILKSVKRPTIAIPNPLVVVFRVCWWSAAFALAASGSSNRRGVVVPGLLKRLGVGLFDARLVDERPFHSLSCR